MTTRFAFSPRIIRSPWADFYHTEIETALEAHPDDYLRAMADQGFGGVWLHAELRDLVPSNLFSDVGPKKIDTLRRFTDKLDRFGLKLYFYVLEPRGLYAPDPFWKKFPHLKGQPSQLMNVGPEFEGINYSLCSSTPEVREYLEGGMYELFRRVDGLGGIFCITASELHTHCYSHVLPTEEIRKDPAFAAWKQFDFQCPRCRERDPVDVVAEVITLLNRGVKRANPSADVIAWTWSWFLIEPDPQPRLISKLPKDVILQSDWERGARKKICGKWFPLDEYSLSYPGPSPRFKKQLAIARANGLRMMAKLQIGKTHEFAAIPYLPVPHLLSLKFEGMRKHKVNGFLACWIFGGNDSPMSRLAGTMSRLPAVPARKAIEKVAEAEFGKPLAGAAVRAWKHFSDAWREYPFSTPFVYNGPINWAVAFPLSMSIKKIPPIASWLPLPRDKKGHLISGDFYDDWMNPFSPAIVVRAFGKLLEKWDKGVTVLAHAMEKNSDSVRLKKEWNLAEYIALSIRSVTNLTEFFPLYRKYQAAAASAKPALAKKLARLLEKELQVTTQARDRVAFDPDLGYHSEAHEHLFTLADLDYKIGLLKKTLGKLR